jgi:hypothetical protein
MPLDPVLVDDGGSIRLRDGNWDMDGFLDVGPLPKPKGAIGSTATVHGDYTEFIVVYLDKFGDPGKVRKQKFQSILITCGADKYVLLEKEVRKLKITIFGIGIAPIVQAEQSRDKRSYKIVNFGPIEAVDSTNRHVYFIGKGVNRPIPRNMKTPVRLTSVVIR